MPRPFSYNSSTTCFDQYRRNTGDTGHELRSSSCQWLPLDVSIVAWRTFPCCTATGLLGRRPGEPDSSSSSNAAHLMHIEHHEPPSSTHPLPVGDARGPVLLGRNVTAVQPHGDARRHHGRQLRFERTSEASRRRFGHNYCQGTASILTGFCQSHANCGTGSYWIKLIRDITTSLDRF